MKKILFSDYDGTFYRNEVELQSNIALINQVREHGNLFVITTGRSLMSFKKVQDRNYTPFDYLILCGGALVYNKDFILIEKTLMSSFQVTSIINDLTKFRQQYKELTFVTVDDRLDTYVTTDEITKITLNVIEKDTALAIKASLDSLLIQINVYVIHIGTSYLVEMVDHKINKSKAITNLVTKKNLGDYQIITVGDSSNDLEMVRDFNGYAMENATLEVKQVTDKIVKNIEHLIKEENLI